MATPLDAANGGGGTESDRCCCCCWNCCCGDALGLNEACPVNNGVEARGDGTAGEVAP